MHLLTPSATDEEIEGAWDAAEGFGGGERVGLLTSWPDDCKLIPGNDVSDQLIDILARSVEGIGLKAFDDEGVVVWAVGELPPPWTEPS
jgi:hypothetical protein